MCHNVCLFPFCGRLFPMDQAVAALEPQTAAACLCSGTPWSPRSCTSCCRAHQAHPIICSGTPGWHQSQTWPPVEGAHSGIPQAPPGHGPGKRWSLDQAWPRPGRVPTHGRRDPHQHVATPANPLSPVSYSVNFLRADVFRRVRLERDVGNLVNFVSFLSPYLTHDLFWAFAP